MLDDPINPFNGTSIIRYVLPSRAHLTISVYDVLGKKVADVVDGIQEPGKRQVRFTHPGLPSGMYFYRMRVRPLVAGEPETVRIRKAVLFR